MKRTIGIMVGLLMAASMTQAQMPSFDFHSTSMMAEDESYMQSPVSIQADEYPTSVNMPALDISRLNAMHQETMRLASEKAEKEAEEEMMANIRRAKPITGGEDMPVGDGLLALMLMAVGYVGARRLYVCRKKQ